MPNEHDDDYKVGFRKPPKHTRFKKGQSGNPKGRPPGSKDFGKLIDRALEERVLVKENGHSRRITKRAALAKQLVHHGISGNVSVTKLLLLLMARFEEAEHRALAQSQEPRTFPSLADIKAAIKFLEDGTEPSPDDDSSSQS
jgi:Family of unknown function (DUF5681)